ncbi:ATP synthase F0 sector subunit b [hydrothermal vent metagenome]|uniref:ATP synthase F0 sector subunit b n=1 Tax=hydrothermal vent metagenome TaxID=652676 RepID=A0A1W1CZ54_9ZZZZ
MKKIVLLSLLVVPAIVLASAAGEETRYFMQTGREYDFLPRLVNFSIFISLLFYVLTQPVKAFFKGRSADIATQLNEIEIKLQVAKDEKKEAQMRLTSSEEKAKEILVDAEAEAKLLAGKIVLANENELLLLDKQQEEKITLEERKSAREAIDEVLSENITTDDINLSEKKVIDILSKKAEHGKVA